ncbi:MAG: hypothetical protein ACLQIB_02355 [Isosphaeraceae bacterium]
MEHDHQAQACRRDFHRLALAAFSGLLAAATTTEAADEGSKRAEKPKDTSNPLLHEPHVCKALNTCKNKGGDGMGGVGMNDCAGQGNCYTAPKHVCHGKNDCRGLGACDTGTWPDYQPGYPGENTCKAMGGCQVPMLPGKEKMWRQARRRFEALRADAGKRLGPPPKDAPKL